MESTMRILTDNEFIDLAILAMEHLDRAIEHLANNAGINITINRDSGLLELEFTNRSKIIISLQLTRREIWVIAQTDRFRFFYDRERDRWVNAHNDMELYSMVAFLISEQSGTPIRF